MSSSFQVSNITVDSAVNQTIIDINDGNRSLEARGFLHVHIAAAGNVTITNTGINNWVQATDSMFSPHIIDGFILNSDNIVVPEDGLYELVFTLTVGISTATLQTVQFGLGINGAEPETALATSRPFSTTIPDGCAGTSIELLSAGDVLRIYGRNLEAGVGNDIILITEGQLTIHKLGTAPPGTEVIS